MEEEIIKETMESRENEEKQEVEETGEMAEAGETEVSCKTIPETSSGSAGENDREENQASASEDDWEPIIEAVLFTMGGSVEIKQLAAAIGQNEKTARKAALSLKKKYEEQKGGMQIIELEDAFQMCTKAEYYDNLIRVAATPKKQVLTEVVLETLSIIAYKQPVTKVEISKIRGVSSDHAVNRLIEYGLVYEAGRLDAPGRPALFATTEEFLRRFGVGSKTDLPTMNPEREEEIREEVQEELADRFQIPEEKDTGKENLLQDAVEERDEGEKTEDLEPENF